MRNEPRQHPIYMVLLGLTALGTVPIWFVRTAPRSWLGLPVWLWSSAGFTFALSILVVWGVLRYWTDEDSS